MRHNNPFPQFAIGFSVYLFTGAAGALLGLILDYLFASFISETSVLIPVAIITNVVWVSITLWAFLRLLKHHASRTISAAQVMTYSIIGIVAIILTLIYSYYFQVKLLRGELAPEPAEAEKYISGSYWIHSVASVVYIIGAALFLLMKTTDGTNRHENLLDEIE